MLFSLDSSTLGVLGLLLAAVWILRRRRISRSKASSPQSPNLKTRTSQPSVQGEWTPVQFSYPPFAACDEPLEELKPPAYRPFRWGKYNITMGIRSMQWEDWIEVDNQLPQYHALRAHRVAARGAKAVDTLPPRLGVPGGAAAAQELVYELAEYLSRRYPRIYGAARHPPQDGDFGWYGDGQIKEITILPLSVSYDLDKEDPMKVSALLIQDDLALMIEGSDGRYYFQAGAICVPGFWRMEDKIGLPLEEIHLSGDVPQYREKLQNSLARFFSKLPVDKPVLRNNYFFQIVRPADDPARAGSIDADELAWSDTTNGPEDSFDQATKAPTHAAQQRAHAPLAPPRAVCAADDVRLRTERQSLRRLPRSGAVVFTIRTYLAPVAALGREPGVPGRMASAMRSWPEDVGLYKGQKLYRDAILPFLDECYSRQVETGIVAEDDRTSKYPL